MKTILELKKQAWTSLKGHRGTMGATVLIYIALTVAVVLLSFIYIGAILQYILMPPFILGLNICFLKFIRNQPVRPGNVTDGIGNMAKAIKLYIVNGLLVALWTLLFIVPGVIKSYSYRLSFYILADNPAMSPAEARDDSVILMEGNKRRLFLLDLSFIGAMILSVLTGGILLFWVMPYMHTAYALFYESLISKKHRYAPSQPDSENANGVS